MGVTIRSLAFLISCSSTYWSRNWSRNVPTVLADRQLQANSQTNVDSVDISSTTNGTNCKWCLKYNNKWLLISVYFHFPKLYLNMHPASWHNLCFVRFYRSKVPSKSFRLFSRNGYIFVPCVKNNKKWLGSTIPTIYPQDYD